MATKKELETMYDKLFEAEKALVLDVEKILTAAKDALTKLSEAQPSSPGAVNNASQQFLLQAVTTMNNIAGYQLANAKTQYGINNPEA